ncbi:MAG: hypothetical protein JWO59_1076, partial [Chloroflexi bacterium]|nr:hypothetical protein [Chloroflexota bacterium]
MSPILGLTFSRAATSRETTKPNVTQA